MDGTHRYLLHLRVSAAGFTPAGHSLDATALHPVGRHRPSTRRRVIAHATDNGPLSRTNSDTLLLLTRPHANSSHSNSDSARMLLHHRLLLALLTLLLLLLLLAGHSTLVLVLLVLVLGETTIG